MSGADDEFDDFLERRKPIFRRDDDDGLEPPAELDRIVLRQAREAIEPSGRSACSARRAGARPLRSPRRCCSALSVVFQVGMPRSVPVGEVTVQNVAREIPPPPHRRSRRSRWRAAPRSRGAVREQARRPNKSDLGPQWAKATRRITRPGSEANEADRPCRTSSVRRADGFR